MPIVNTIPVQSKGTGYPDYGVNISGQPDINIAAQGVGVYSSGDWQVLLGNQKQISLTATGVNTYSLSDLYDPYLVSAVYNIPADKDYWIYMLNGSMTYVTPATSIQNWVVEIYDNTVGVRLYSMASTGPQSDVQFAQPIKALRGHQLLLNFYNYGTPGPSTLLGNPSWNAPVFSLVTATPGVLTAYSKFLAAYNGGMKTISFTVASPVWNGDVRVALYADNAGVPGNVLNQGGPVNYAAMNPITGTIAIPLSSIVIGTTYWLGVSFTDAGNLIRIYYTADAAGDTYYKEAYGAFVNNPAGLTHLGAGFSICACGFNNVTVTHDNNFATARLVGYEA